MIQKFNIHRIIDREKAKKPFAVGERRIIPPINPPDPTECRFLQLSTINSGSPAISDTEWFRPTGERINTVGESDEITREGFSAKYSGAILASSRKNVRTVDVHEKWGRIVLSDAALKIWLEMDLEGFFHAPVKLYFADGTWSAKAYNLVRVARVIDAVDWERTGYKLKGDRALPDGDVQVTYDYVGPVAFSDEIPSNVHMFNLPVSASPQLLSRSLVQAMTKAKITGFRTRNLGK